MLAADIQRCQGHPSQIRPAYVLPMCRDCERRAAVIADFNAVEWLGATDVRPWGIPPAKHVDGKWVCDMRVAPAELEGA